MAAHRAVAGRLTAIAGARLRSSLLGLAIAAATPVAAQTDAEIVELTAADLAAEIAAGRVSAERATQVFLARIAALDDAGPLLGAIIEVNPDALDIARSLDRRLQSGEIVGPLHGVPVVLKASIDTADKLATSAGSLALAAHHANADAPVVARLRAAGAVILGKANLSEWANFRSTRSISGWSSLGGQTRNPYVLDRNPCGSSSGSAVAVAARLVPLAVGTETDGSIVCPSGINGVVGIKPTLGLVAQTGIVPIAPSQDTAGPIARTVRDAALLLGAIVEPEPGRPAPAYLPARLSLEGVRVGVLGDYVGGGSPVEDAYDEVLALLRAAGAELVQPVDVAFERDVRAAELEILLSEFREHIGRYLAGAESGPRTLDELIEYNVAHAREVMPLFGQELFLQAQQRGGLDAPAYRAALATAAEFRAAVGRLFAEQNLDVLVAPTNGRAWRIEARSGAGLISSSMLAAVSGYPSITVPAALDAELPIGVTFVGEPRQEAELIDIAAAFERVRGAFPAPRSLPSAGD